MKPFSRIDTDRQQSNKQRDRDRQAERKAKHTTRPVFSVTEVKAFRVMSPAKEQRRYA